MLMKKKVTSMGLATIMCFGILSGCGNKSDMDKLIGTWQVDDLDAGTRYDDYIIEFYEPYEEDSTDGDLGYINSHGAQRRGKYNYHESSKTLELSLYDEFNVPNDWTDYLTMILEIEDDNCIYLQSEDFTFELTKVNE